MAIIHVLTPLPRDFYARPVLEVARDCVGKLLVSEESRQTVVGRIVETEAYKGPGDRAAHSYNNRRTTRTEAMFGPAGHAYIFRIYGLHYNFNVVTGELNEPEAVLIRAVEPLMGSALMARRRKQPPRARALTNGPGKLCQAFAIDGRHYARDLTRGGLFLANNPSGPEKTPAPKLRSSPRIGVDYAGSWAQKHWRFFEADNRWVSGSRKTNS